VVILGKYKIKKPSAATLGKCTKNLLIEKNKTLDLFWSKSPMIFLYNNILSNDK